MAKIKRTPDRAFTRFYLPSLMPHWVRRMKDAAHMADWQDARAAKLRLEASRKSGSVATQVTSDILAGDEMYSDGREI